MQRWSNNIARTSLPSISAIVALIMLLTTASPVGRAQVATTQPVVSARGQEVIDGCLRYLAAAQTPTGSWSNSDHQAAITGYALMAFMSAGELPGEGEYGPTVSRGVDYLLSCVRSDGYIAGNDGENNMYGHGIATIALAEVYGQTGDQAIKPALEKAVQLIVACQNEQGGWRYQPRPFDADISVTVLQVVALRAAKNAGIDVPQATIDQAVAFVKGCHLAGGGFGYQAGQTEPGFARTAAAIYSLQVCGLYDDPFVKEGSDYLIAQRDSDRLWYTYGNFYAAPAQYMIGGPTWREWYQNISEELLAHVKTQSAGVCYFTPVEARTYPSNEVYATSVYTMILAMPYHYIPLYQR